MSRRGRLRPLDLQIEEYRLQFELAALVKKELADIRKKYADRVSPESVREAISAQSAACGLGWNGHDWVWYPDWDGVLIDKCRKLEAAGFTIVQFWRKWKIVFRLEGKEKLTRRQLIERVCDAIGDDFDGITFGRNIVVWREPKGK